MFKVPEQFRNKTHQFYASDESFGNNGMFEFTYKGYYVKCIASDGMGWEHVSVTINRNRTPSWELMCYVKSLFWDGSDTVVQYHPPDEFYVNMHEYCLHLWSPVAFDIPVPPPELVGIIGEKK